MILSALLLFSATACGQNENDVYTPKTYELNAAYIGTGYTESENVKGVSVYNSTAEYKASEMAGSALWVEEAMADTELVSDAIKSKKTVIIIAEESIDAASLAKKFTNASLTEKPEGELELLGILLTGITETEYDAVALYCTDASAPQTDFLAFCSEYSYAQRYQGKALETDILSDVSVIKNCFSAVNFAEQAYAVMFATLADYGDNPTGGSSTYKYEYTLMSYADVVCVKGRSAGFNSLIYAGGDGQTLKVCPENGTDFENGSSIDMNFLFKRYFKASFDIDYTGNIASLVKGRDSFMEWRICSADKKGNEQLRYVDKNFTGAIDCINTNGIYTPVFEISFSTDNGETTSDWSFSISMNETSAKAE